MKRLLYLFCFGVSTFTVQAQDFDNTFDGDGWKTDLMVGLTESYTDVVIQADKKILVAGANLDNNEKYHPFVRRFNTNGSRDNSFGSAGHVETPYNTTIGTEGYAAIEIDANGKIYIATSSDAANSGLQVSRLNSNGTIDNSFGTNGTVIDSTGDHVNFEDVVGITIQSDGKILICGLYKHTIPNETGAFVIRYNANGSHDASFGTNGLVKVLGENFVANKMVVQADGKILAGGKRRLTTQQKDDFLVFRLNTNGTLDNTYGPNQDGIVIIGLQDIETIRDMALQSDGSLIFGGPCGNGYTHTRIVKLQPNGVGDVNFGTEHTSTGNIGYTKLDFAQFTNQFITSLAITADDKIIVGGGWNNEIFTIRYTAGGIPDSSFSGNARADSTFFQNLIGNEAGALDEASGRYYAIGRIAFANSTPEMFVAAFKIGPGTAPSDIEEYGVKTDLLIYPNPANDDIFLPASAEKYNQVDIYNSTGQLVKSERNLTSNSINVSLFSNGIYFLKIYVGDTYKTSRMVVSK